MAINLPKNESDVVNRQKADVQNALPKSNPFLKNGLLTALVQSSGYRFFDMYQLLDTVQKDFLIVDDNPILRDSMVTTVKKYLEKDKIIKNYQIKEGNDGKDLIRHILDDTKNEIKFVITDENMEIISGSLAIKFLKEVEKRKLIDQKIYILASSDNANYLENGFDYCIQKPIKIDELSDIIKEHKNDK